MRRSPLCLAALTLLAACAARPLALPEPGSDLSVAPRDMAAADRPRLDDAVSVDLGVDQMADLAPDLLTACTVEPVTLGAPLSSATPLMDVAVIALGDFNEDGHLDAATASVSGSSYLAFGDGAGRFGVPIALPQGVLAAADFNRDGHADLLFSDPNGGIDVALGHGDGTFAAPTQFRFGDVSTWFGALAVGDLNGDGKLDIASSYSAPERDSATGLAVLLGNGDGTFGAAQLLPTVIVAQGYRNQLAMGDVDGDGHVDLVLSQPAGLQLFAGHGDGTLAPGVTLVTSPIDSGFALADLNGDHALDLLVPDDDQDTLSVLLGRGDGTFVTRASYSLDTPPISVLVADLNSDGHPDVTVIGVDFAVALGGNGDGTLSPGPLFNCAGGMYCAPAIADVDGDGKLDLVVGAGDGIRTFRGLGSNRQFDTPVWPSPSPFAQPDAPLLLADLDGDHISDVIVSWGLRELSVQRGRSDGSLAQPQPILLPTGVAASSVTAADFDGDGLVDLVVAMDDPTFGLLLLPGRGNGTFSPGVTLPGLSNFPQSLATGDFDGDGLADLAFVDYRDNVGIAYGHGDGTFTAPVTYATDRSALQITVGDLDGDGRSDLVAATFTDALHTIIYSFIGRGDRQLAAPISQLIELTDGVSQLALGDLDGDGVLDLALTGRGSYVMHGRGDGTFTDLTQLTPNFAQQIAISDLNGDGRADVVTGNPVCLFVAGCDGALHPGDCYFTYGSTPLLLSPPAPGAPPNLIIGTGTVTVVRNETR